MNPLLLVLILAAAPPRTAPKVPGATIQVEDQELHIPLLPRNRVDARWHLKQAQTEFEASGKVVDHYLATLATPLLGPGDSATVPGAQVTEARLLAARLEDDRFAGLLGALLKELKAWDADSKGPAQLPQSVQDERRKGGTDVLKYVPINPDAPAGATPIDDTSPNGPFQDVDASKGGGEWNKNATPLKDLRHPYLREGATLREEVAAAEEHQVQVARRHEVDLTKRWAAVLQQLEGDAREVAALVATPPEPRTPALLELRRRVKLQLVERYQAVLKLCRFMWVGLAAEPAAVKAPGSAPAPRSR
jgi:hypothetical protein